MQQQFIGLICCRLAIIAGDADLQICRDERALEAVDLSFDRRHHGHCIGSRSFAHRERHCRLTFMATASAEKDIVFRFFRPIDNFGNLVQIDRGAGIHTDHYPADLGCRGQKSAGLQKHLLVQGLQAAGIGLEIDLLDLGGDIGHGKVVGSKQQGIETDR